MKRVLFISSTGGHLNELLQLRKTMKKYDSYLITEKTKSTEGLRKEFGNKVLSDCFKLNVTYTNAKGESVTETGVTLPWEKTIEVTSPFKAKMQGELVYNVDELPEKVTFGKCYGIGYYNNSSLVIEMVGAFSVDDKEGFLELLQHNPDRLKFTEEKNF